jgi:hypothetical protein
LKALRWYGHHLNEAQPSPPGFGEQRPHQPSDVVAQRTAQRMQRVAAMRQLVTTARDFTHRGTKTQG